MTPNTLSTSDVARLMHHTTKFAQQELKRRGVKPYASVKFGKKKYCLLWSAEEATKAAAAYRKDVEQRKALLKQQKLEPTSKTKPAVKTKKRKYTRRTNGAATTETQGKHAARTMHYTNLVRQVEELTAAVNNLAALWGQQPQSTGAALNTLTFDDEMSTGQGPRHGGHTSIS